MDRKNHHGIIHSECVIIGAGDTPEKTTLPCGENDFIICADAGYSKAKELCGREPDLIVGDFDSLGFVPDSDKVIVSPSEKDETDMMLAVMEGFDRGYTSFNIFGALGGERADHSVGNLQLLHYIVERGGRGFIISGDRIFTAIKNSALPFGSDLSGYISVFSMTDKSEGVTIKGLKYEVENTTLYSHKPIGVSNEFTGKEAFVEVGNGVLLISWTKACG